jgi:nucleoid-associated protein YgaU
MSNRWKIAVVAAILAAGAGAAILFRKDPGQASGSKAAKDPGARRPGEAAVAGSPRREPSAANSAVATANPSAPGDAFRSSTAGRADENRAGSGSPRGADAGASADGGWPPPATADPAGDGKSGSPAGSPAATASPQGDTGQIVTHRIKDGDTLPRLAERYLGSASRAEEIFRQNQQVLPAPDLLPVGKVLRIAVSGR